MNPFDYRDSLSSNFEELNDELMDQKLTLLQGTASVRNTCISYLQTTSKLIHSS